MRFILALSLLILTACETNHTSEKADKSKREKVSTADIEAGIRDHIEKTRKQNDGFFPLTTESDTMQLKLVRVHTEYLSNLGPDSHFACVDLADEGGDVYDVDFFLSGKPGEMEVTETTLHKENGKPFYTWKQKEDKTWERVKVEQSNNRLMGVVEGEDSFVFRYEVALPAISDSAKIWIPIPTSNEWQEVELIAGNYPDNGSFRLEEQEGNRYFFAELSTSEGEKNIFFEYTVSRKEKSPYRADHEDTRQYLRSSELMPVGGRFETIASEVLRATDSDTDLMKARALYDFVADTVRYRKAGEYGTGDANYACDSRSGNCTEFHSYFISLARSAGIPARFAIGAAIPSERNEGGVNGYHCWAEFYAEEKWWPVDISEGNKYSTLSTYYFGHHPANRIEFSKGRDLLLEPLPESGKVPFFAYPIFEMEGKKNPVKTTFSFDRTNQKSQG